MELKASLMLSCRWLQGLLNLKQCLRGSYTYLSVLADVYVWSRHYSHICFVYSFFDYINFCPLWHIRIFKLTCCVLKNCLMAYLHFGMESVYILWWLTHVLPWKALCWEYHKGGQKGETKGKDTNYGECNLYYCSPGNISQQKSVRTKSCRFYFCNSLPLLSP